MSVVLKDLSSTVEDLLATDDLFIEYFNSYLSLPTFPEPVCFNKETGGFEVVNNERTKLAKEIKAAVRSGRRRRRIYRAVRNHSYSDIPLVPMEEPPQEEEKEINTSFDVQTLNKEQGIQWIKAERLPAFLESDCYHRYRLAKLLSQASLSDRPDQFISMTVNNKVRVKQVEPEVKSEETEEKKKQHAQKQGLMKDLFVCMGETGTTDTEAWVAQVTMVGSTDTTQTSTTRPTSSVSSASRTRSRPLSSRPLSSRPMSGTSTVADSGYWSVGPTEHNELLEVSEDVVQEDDVTKRSRPLLGDICQVAEEPMEEDGSRTRRGIVYATPIPAADEQEAPSSECIGNKTGGSIEDTDLQEMMEVRASKTAGSEDTGEKPLDVDGHPQVKQLFPEDKQSEQECNLGDDKGIALDNPKHEMVKSLNDLNRSVRLDDEKDKDSDEDSLLNSDDDYDNERDTFFRKNKPIKKLSLKKKRGVHAFSKFLEGTTGEKNWCLWLDIEKVKKITDKETISLYLSGMRDKYQKTGSLHELDPTIKRDLGLVEPSQWTVSKLTDIQNKIVEPLLLYWAPRFLLNQQSGAHPEKSCLYHHQKTVNSQSQRPDPYPNPPTAELLPLRPKSCVPRLAPQMQPQTIQISSMFDEPQIPADASLAPTATTTPTVGQKRHYRVSDAFLSSTNRKRDKNISNKVRQTMQKTPRQLVAPLVNLVNGRGSMRPPSAPAALGRERRSQQQDWEVGSSASAVAGTPRRGVSPRRPTSAASSRGRADSCAGSEVSEYLGGRRMEGLLKALTNEKNAGGFFHKFVKRAGNQLWGNCLSFWRVLQQYHTLFYQDIIDDFGLRKKAQSIYSQHVVAGAPFSIQASLTIREEVHYRLDPPYEELFDDAEEYVLAVLYDAWSQLLVTDISTFDKVELVEVKRHLDTKSRYVVTLQRRGIIRERPTTPDDPMEGYQDPVYDPSLLNRIPPEFQEFTLDKLVHNRLELEHFREFLSNNYASMDLMCWMEMEAFRRVAPSQEKQRNQKAKDIKLKYLNKKYFFGANSPAGKEGQEKVVEAGGGWGKLLEDLPPTPMILAAQAYVQERLEKKWLPQFLATEEFADRQRPRSGMSEVVEDVMIHRKKKSQAIFKMLESKWISSSKDILTFRKALTNSITSHHFRRYVSIKGDNFENDVLFWQEVQKYKDLCHQHSDRALAQAKTLAIINCFIDSPIPPSLQIDVTQEIADHILERKMEATPYLFREAQLMVFRILFSHWTDFCTYRSNMTDDRILPTIERHRRRQRAKQKKRQKEVDDKEEKEAARRKALGIPPEAKDGDAYHDPFHRTSLGSEDGSRESGGGGRHDKDSVAFSYSNYMQALEHEETLNGVDASTFSTLSSLNSGKDDDDSTDSDSRSGESEGSPTGESTSHPGSSDVTGSKSAASHSMHRRKPHSGQSDMHFLKPSMRDHESGSQTETRSKSSRAPSSRLHTRRSRESEGSRPQYGRPSTSVSRGARRGRMARTMPPLPQEP